ncbi:lipopolysaccharide assembly protein LapA domain-containing protein [Psychroflexus lacisalsi]|jgi:uncharacterized integral membrane protein|uniref:lipopolysaccharide assembly protein LapA domain-containing protein n=1 Tax=Psychroflexus lacisalsi TaxID=503928 RepID=UPI001CCD3A1F|nr:lipopolysaccharide assembly protein LapA domain-containing protein [Psychroflexus lacisalsi]MBZ9618912.1 lipopolysaccharide assembly protein LapA domain-containing protein [Psychroflexus lacisalsi]
MRTLKSILLLIIVLAAIIFAFQNMETVNLKFFNWKLQIPLSAASALLYILGAISGGLIFSMLKKLTLEEKRKK